MHAENFMALHLHFFYKVYLGTQKTDRDAEGNKQR